MESNLKEILKYLSCGKTAKEFRVKNKNDRHIFRFDCDCGVKNIMISIG
jgi:hypothetical protein